jgi:DNA repair protein RadA/Sms
MTLNPVGGLTSVVAYIAARGTPRVDREGNREPNRDITGSEKNATPARFRRGEG